jgi:putative protease
MEENKVEKKEMEEKEIGIITHYFGKISVGIIELNAPLKVGDTIHIKGAHDDFNQTIDSMQIEHDVVESADKGDFVGIKVIHQVHANDKVFLVTE